MARGEVFISRKTIKTSEKVYASFTFSRAIHWVGQESLPSPFWSPGLKFDISALTNQALTLVWGTGETCVQNHTQLQNRKFIFFNHPPSRCPLLSPAPVCPLRCASVGSQFTLTLNDFALQRLRFSLTHLMALSHLNPVCGCYLERYEKQPQATSQPESQGWRGVCVYVVYVRRCINVWQERGTGHEVVGHAGAHKRENILG